MEIELKEILDFLKQHPPFELLSGEQLGALIPEVAIRYLRRSSVFPPERDAADSFFIVRSGSIELRNAKGELREKLAEGGLFFAYCNDMAALESLEGRVTEDALIYQLPCKLLQKLVETHAGFQQYFSASLRDSMKRAIEGLRRSEFNNVGFYSRRVTDLVHRQPVTVEVNSSIQDAARTMSAHNISSILVMEGGLLKGLVTDRDLRRRCILDGLPVENPVGSIMTTGLYTLDESAQLSDALMMMTHKNINHLPIMRGDSLLGMISSTDLMRHQGSNAPLLVSDISKAKTLEDLVRASALLPEVQLQMAEASATAYQVGQAVSAITDAITIKLIEMAEKNLGIAPVPYTWLAGGSQARREQSSHSDQDNALLISDQMKPEHEGYFESLARFVNDGLNACGFVYCPGEAMANNPMWRKSMATWRTYFTRWIEKPEPKALMLSSIFFDLRPVYGDTGLFTRLQGEVLEMTKKNRIFIAYMVSNALTHRPPLGFFRNFVLEHDEEHRDTLDLKHRGVVPITDIARIFALSEGVPEVNTTARLKAATDSGAISREMGQNLVDALEFIAFLRIRHQAGQIRAGIKADNYLSPRDLSGFERNHLKNAFQVIKLMQETLENRYQIGRFN